MMREKVLLLSGMAMLMLSVSCQSPAPVKYAEVTGNQDVRYTAEEWAAMRDKTLADYHIIIDDDGCDMTEFPKDLELTRENIYKQMLDAVKGTEVDTVSFCPFSVGHRLATRSLVTDVHVERAALDRDRNVTPELLALGTDTMQVAVEFCRQNKVKVLANFRVNDVHDAWYKHWMYGIKVAHPEQLIGTEENKPLFGSWTAFNFALPEVRQRAFAICKELLSHYDVDGLEMDFYRFPVFFKSVAWGGSASAEEVEAMTQLMRDVRAEADRIGKIRGRYLVVATRVPDSAPVAKDAGLDIDTWMREKLIDIFIAGGDGGYYNTYEGAVALGRRHGIKVFPSIDTSWMGGGRNSIPGYTAQAAAALNAGADGLFYFNMFYAKPYIKLMHRNLDDLRLMDKQYYGYYQRSGSFTAISAKTPELDELGNRRGDRLYLREGQLAATMQMEIGDDFSRPEVLAKNPQLKLRVETKLNEDYKDYQLKAAINGTPLPKPAFEKGTFVFDVAPAVLKPGANYFEFEGMDPLKKIAPWMILKGDVILRGGNQPPWRRLWTAHDFANAEKIVDNSYRLIDSGTGETECENLLYPIVPFDHAVTCEFEMIGEGSTAPEAIAFRIANGEFVEVLCFGPDAISLKYHGGVFPFKTDDAFHAYRVETKGNNLKLFADGTLLADVTLPMAASNPACHLKGTHSTIPNMNDSSVAIGSFSGPGTSSSRWKNMTLSLPYVQIHDVSLTLTFPKK